MKTWRIIYTKNSLICTAETKEAAHDENQSWEYFCAQGRYVETVALQRGVTCRPTQTQCC